MFYTKTGDDGDTSRFGDKKRMSKGDIVFEALGTVDELGSWLGVCVSRASHGADEIKNILGDIQNDLFSVQAEIGGADKKIERKRVKWAETKIESVGKKIPPVRDFVVTGGGSLSAEIDFARAITRRTERATVRAKESGIKISDATLAYLNRLSSLLFALARLANAKFGITERSPRY